MRLESSQIQAIKKVINQVLNAPYKIWVFGSRADAQKKGGDIDLLIETDTVISNHAEMICRIYGALIMALGDRKIDILLKDSQTEILPIFEIAKQYGKVL
jgi:predicted nucleotidyltransferase